MLNGGLFLKWKMSLTRDVLSRSSVLTHQKFFPNLFIRKTRNYTFYIAFIYTDMSFSLSLQKQPNKIFPHFYNCNNVNIILFSCFDFSLFRLFNIWYFFAILSAKKRFCRKVAKPWRKYWMVTVTLENSHFCLNFKEISKKYLKEI